MKISQKDLQKSETLATYIYELQKVQGNEVAIEALTTWYALKDIAKLKAKFPVKTLKQGNLNVEEFLQKNQNWLNNIGVTYTPLFIINHQKISLDYRLSDIKYHLRNMDTIPKPEKQISQPA